MQVLLNSDLLYKDYLIRDRLPEPIAQLCKACAEHGIPILLPETALLEIRRNQEKLAEDEQKRIESAFKMVERYGVKVDRRDPRELVPRPDIIAMMSELGVKVEVIVPTLDDYNEAHRRACLHNPPQRPDAKSDEMRDLIIWNIAIRVARDAGGALLLSRDDVHTHSRGDDEASAAGLLREDSIEKGLEVLEIESPTGSLARKILEPLWPDLVAGGLPLPSQISLKSVREAVFVQGKKTFAEARFRMFALTDKQDRLEAIIRLKVDEDIIKSVTLDDIRVSGEPWGEGRLQLTTNRPAPQQVETYDQRISALRSLLEDENEHSNG